MSKHKSCWLWILLFFSLIFMPFPSHPDSRMEIHNLRYHTHPSYTRIVVDIGKLREYVFSEPFSLQIEFMLISTRPNLILFYIAKYSLLRMTTSNKYVLLKRHLLRSELWLTLISRKHIIGSGTSPTLSGSSLIYIPPNALVFLSLSTCQIRIKHNPPVRLGNPESCHRSWPRRKRSWLRRKKRTQGKKIVLDVATRLKKILESKENLEVIMTRESDIYLDPESRTVIANQKQADLFISIHANANRSRKLSGIESFYLNFSQDPSVIETAARENATSTKNISAMKDIIERIVQNSKIVESKELAESIQNSLVKSLSQKYSNVKSLGVKGGPFWVLIGGEMPSVLVEISHLSNPTEEKRLKSPQYRQRVAQGIYEGIKEYVNSLGKGK